MVFYTHTIPCMYMCQFVCVCVCVHVHCLCLMVHDNFCIPSLISRQQMLCTLFINCVHFARDIYCHWICMTVELLLREFIIMC